MGGIIILVITIMCTATDFIHLFYSKMEKIEISGNTHTDCVKITEYNSPENHAKLWNRKEKLVYSEYIIMDKLLGFLDTDTQKKNYSSCISHCSYRIDQRL